MEAVKNRTFNGGFGGKSRDEISTPYIETVTGTSLEKSSSHDPRYSCIM